MRRILVGLVAVLFVSASGCSAGDTFAVEFTHPQEHGAIPFTASGGAVDETAVCGTGTMEMNHLESIEGATITDNDWADMFDTAMADGGVAEMYVFQDFVCDDGAGAFIMKFHNRFDFSTFQFEGQQDVGTWEIEEGSGNYEGFSGSGDATLDWDAGEVIYGGEIETG